MDVVLAIKNTVEGTVEGKEFGWNTITIVALATIFFSFLQGYGIIRQSKEIWRRESGESITPAFFFYNFIYFLTFFVYGIEEKYIAITFNGALCFFYIPILLGLKKFKKFSRLDKILILSMTPMIPLIFIYPDKSHLLFAFSLISLVVIILQFKVILETRKFGAFSVQYLWMFFITSVFWSIYYMATKNWLLEIPCVAGVSLYCLVLILEKKWRDNTE